MSKSLLVRFHGFGDFPNEATAFTTNALPPYQVGIGVKAVVSVPDSFSSSVTPFEPVGSDPSVSISLLNTPDVRRILLSSALVPCKNPLTGETVRTRGYIPTTRPFTVEVTDSTPFLPLDAITIANERLIVTAVPTSTSITIDTASESIPTPKAWSSIATGIGGVPVYRSLPSLEGAFVSVAIMDDETTVVRADEEIVFRGFVRGWSMDTSAGGPGLLKVSIGGLLAALSTRVLTAPPVKVTNLDLIAGDAVNPFDMIYPSRLGGEAPDVCADGYTAPSFVYVVPKRGALTGVWSFWQVGARTTKIDNTDEPGTFLQLGDSTGAAGFPLSIGYGSRATVLAGAPNSTSIRGELAPNGLQDSYQEIMTRGDLETWRSLRFYPETNPGSIMFAYYGYGFVDVIRSLFTGRNTVDPLAEYPVTMAAWLPTGCVDTTSLSRFEFVAQPKNLVTSYIAGIAVDSLPPADVDGKTLLDFITESVLAPNAGCIVQDGASLRVFSWAGINAAPRSIGFASLANPAASLTSSRSSYLKQVNVTIGTSIANFWGGEVKLTAESTDVFYSDYYTGGVGGKTLTLADNSLTDTRGGTETNPPDQVPRSLDSTVGSYAVTLLNRWGAPAPMLTLTLRDNFGRLQLGEDVRITLDQVPGNDGGMGITKSRGVVIESVRSWSKGETEYKIALIGYTNSQPKAGYWGATAELSGAGSPGVLNVYQHRFTEGYIASATGGEAFGVPSDDVDAFIQIEKMTGANVYLALYDARGVPLPTVTYPILDGGGSGGTTLAYSGSFSPTVPAAGMIVTLAPYGFQPAADTFIDAYLADTSGTVSGQDPWTWQS